MSERASNKVELTPQARQALEIEAALRRTNLKDLASELVLCGVSKKTLEFVSLSQNQETQT